MDRACTEMLCGATEALRRGPGRRRFTRSVLVQVVGLAQGGAGPLLSVSILLGAKWQRTALRTSLQERPPV